MALFDTYSRSSKELDKNLREKLAKKAQPKTGKANNLLTRINLIRSRVSENLGEYQDDYKILIKDEEVKDYFNKILESGICAIDTETTGLNFFTDNIVGICLYLEGEKASYIPLNHISSIYQTRIENQANIELVKELLKKCVDQDIKFIYHNGKFDINVLETFLGFKMNCPYWDTLVASHLITNDENQRSLKDQYSKYCSQVENKEKIETLSHFNDLFEGLRFDYVPIESGYIYAARDAFMTYKLYEYQKAIFEQEEYKDTYKLFREVEIPIIEVTASMQRTGVAIDLELAKKLKDEYTEKLNTITETVYNEIKVYEYLIIKYKMLHYNCKLQEPINFNSNDQLAILLYDIIGCIPDKEKPRGVAEDILKKIDLPLTNAILEYRSVAKLLSTYIEAIPNKIEPATGRLHASFNQNGTDTGRFSSSDPNLQNIPRDGGIRNMFKASEGYVMIGCDYSQQEPRITAHLCGDENMVQAYKVGRDLYSSMASIAFHVPYEECLEFYLDENGKKTEKVNKEGKKRRSHIKAIFLGICYGKGVPAIAADLKITVEEAQTVYDSMFEGFPKLKKWSEDMQALAKKCGYTTTLWGRRRYLKHIQKEKYEYHYGANRPINFDPLFDSEEEDIDNNVTQDIKDYYNNQLERANYVKRRQITEQAAKDGIIIVDNSGFLAESIRQVVNGIVQGSAADLTKKSLVDLYRNEELRSLGFRLLMSVHDENIGECPYENRERVKELIREVMIKANDRCSVPMKGDVDCVFYWYGSQID